MELKIYQYYYGSIRDLLEDKYSGDGRQVQKKVKGTRDQKAY